jgi:hypothetical protein
MDNDLVPTRLGKFKVIGSDFIPLGFSPIDGLISRFKYYSKKIAVHKIYKNYTDGPSNNNNSSVLSLKVADINI